MITQERILVIKLGAFGDFVQALGPMKAIREFHPEAHITLLTTKPFRVLAEESKYFNSISIDVKPKWFHWLKWIKLKRWFNQQDFKRVYDLQNNDRTFLYFKLFQPKPEWVGAAKGASHRNASRERTAGHAFDGHVQTLKLAGLENVEIDDLSWIKSDISKFKLQTPYILIVPGSAPSRPEKRWSAHSYAELARLLAEEHSIQPVIIGTDAEAGVTAVIKNGCKQALDLTGKTSLMDLAPLAHGALAAVGNDTGPMHMIGVTGIPSYVVFSQHSNPVKHAPKGKNVEIIVQDNLDNLAVEKVMQSLQQKISL